MTRVLLVDDETLVRAALTMMLDGAEGIRVVGEAADGADVPDAVAACFPDVVLMDLRMPRVGGIAATRRLRARPNPPEVIVLTTFDTDENVVEALRAGAAGFLLKDSPPARIVAAVRQVASGEPMLSPQITRRLMAHVTDRADAARRARAALAALTPRERDVAVAVAGGEGNAEIGAALGMGVPTVKAHVSSILAKLELNNRTQLALLVHDAELL
ncbi:response regulator transcription factor [Actinomadura parmotrematis]|uniref:Response regulator transcription factor n=1 Tax=Actinomadura parmotrematis TaxID=2864039 RepID=A0ABS7G320_9ACTN|nr:response regulator transcription factor [Actinomadura parmotrematis]MBW8486946.1 response regulator transcription factor [Actinomadura parmotrematis]